MEYERLNVASFAKKIGVIDQTVRGIVVQKRNKPGFDLLAKVIQTFSWINAEWLMTGEGEMIKTAGFDKTELTPPSLSELIQYLKEKDVKIEKLIEEKTELKVKLELVKKMTVKKEEKAVYSAVEYSSITKM